MTPSRNLRVCSRCGVRPAFYHRVHSGELLCRICLRKSLLSKIRRVISKHELLREDSEILLVVPPCEVHRAAADLFSQVEEAFPRVNLKIEYLSAASGDYWDTLISAAKYAVEGADGRVPALPLTLDDALGLFLLFYSGRPAALALGGRLGLGPSAVEGGGPVVLPVVEIPNEEICALFEIRPPEDPILTALRDIELATPGAKMNLFRTYHRLLAPGGGGTVF